MNARNAVKKTSSVTINISPIIFVILVILKLAGEVEMGWFWVLTSWVWVPVLALISIWVLFFGFAAIFLILAAIVQVFSK